MADIFVSYYNRDRKRVAPVVGLLEAQGWTVWWDTSLKAGERWDDVIERELAKARCVVVCWSPGAVASHWVRSEAHAGHERGILVPLFLEKVTLPVGFALIQTKDVSKWRGKHDAPEAKAIVEAVSTVLKLPIAAIRKPSPRPSGPPAGLIAIGVLALLGGAYFVIRSPSRPPEKPVVVVPPKPTAADVARVWDHIKDTKTITVFEAFRGDFGKDFPTYDRMAVDRIDGLKRDAAVKTPAPSALVTTAPTTTTTAPSSSVGSKPWTFDTPGLGSLDSCAQASTEAACKLSFGCSWSKPGNFFGSCKTFSFNSPSSPPATTSPPATATSPPFEFNTCFLVSSEKDCEARLDCSWDKTAKNCKKWTFPIGSSTTTAPKAATIPPQSNNLPSGSNCELSSNEKDCNRNTACIWLWNTLTHKHYCGRSYR